MIARLSAQIAPSDEGVGYFSNLPRYALPPLQAAFDRVMTRQFGSQAIHTSLKKDFLVLGVEAPSFSVLNEWIEGVLHGRVERPLGPIENDSAPAASIEPVGPISIQANGQEERAHRAANPEPFSLLRPTDLQATKTAPSALSDLVAQMVDEATADLQADAPRAAKKLVAKQLRELANDVEASGS